MPAVPRVEPEGKFGVETNSMITTNPADHPVTRVVWVEHLARTFTVYVPEVLQAFIREALPQVERSVVPSPFQSY